MKFKGVFFKKVVLPQDEAGLQFLADNLRKIDKIEVLAQGFDSVYQALEFSVAQSQEAYFGIAGGKMVCVFGVSKNYYDNFGYPAWFLATDRLFEYKKEFLHYTKLIVKDWTKRYKILHNYVLKDNVQSVRWLKWLGAEFLADGNFADGKKCVLFILKGDD